MVSFNKNEYAILSVLLKHMDRGVWLRKLAREAKLSPSTVSKYLYSSLREYVRVREMENIPQRRTLFIMLKKRPEGFKS